jgi:hypothetical protein
MVNKKLSFLDIRKEISTLKDSAGFFWLALRSVVLTEPCIECSKAVGGNYDQPNPSCTTCLGIGYTWIDKIVKGFTYQFAPGFDFRSELGVINTQSRVYILEHDTFPKNKDYILELDLNEKTGKPKQPFKINRSFKVQGAFPHRGEEGRIEHWRCFTEERNFTKAGEGVL